MLTLFRYDLHEQPVDADHYIQVAGHPFAGVRDTISCVPLLDGFQAVLSGLALHHLLDRFWSIVPS